MREFTLHTKDSASSPADTTLRNLESGLGFVPNVFAVAAESAPPLMLNTKPRERLFRR